jgi:hypothetical protein
MSRLIIFSYVVEATYNHRLILAVDQTLGDQIDILISEDDLPPLEVEHWGMNDPYEVKVSQLSADSRRS